MTHTSPRTPSSPSLPQSRRSFVLGLGSLGVSLSMLFSESAQAEGRSSFVINSLLLPTGLESARTVEQELRSFIKKEARRQDWGGDRKNQVEARFELRALKYKLQGSTLHVSATLIGRLPSGRTAESTISFGGSANQKMPLTRQVLRIVATGVVTRLADMERKRRGL